MDPDPNKGIWSLPYLIPIMVYLYPYLTPMKVCIIVHTPQTNNMSPRKIDLTPGSSVQTVDAMIVGVARLELSNIK